MGSRVPYPGRHIGWIALIEHFTGGRKRGAVGGGLGYSSLAQHESDVGCESHETKQHHHAQSGHHQNLTACVSPFFHCHSSRILPVSRTVARSVLLCALSNVCGRIVITQPLAGAPPVPAG